MHDRPIDAAAQQIPAPRRAVHGLRLRDRRTLTLTIAILVGACTAGDPMTARRGPGPPTNGVDELRELHGLSEAQLVARLGQSGSQREFSMAECCTEFEIELNNTYRPERTDRAKIRIRALTWDYDGYRVTAWLHRAGGGWRVLDTIRYADGVSF